MQLFVAMHENVKPKNISKIGQRRFSLSHTAHKRTKNNEVSFEKEEFYILIQAFLLHSLKINLKGEKSCVAKNAIINPFKNKRDHWVDE